MSMHPTFSAHLHAVAMVVDEAIPESIALTAASTCAWASGLSASKNGRSRWLKRIEADMIDFQQQVCIMEIGQARGV